jgi:hypothetical protein
MTGSIDSFLGAWSAAERARDTGKLDSLGLGQPRQESDRLHLGGAVDIAGGEVML